LESTHGHHRTVVRRYVACNYRLQRHNERRSRNHRVYRELRHCAVSTLTGEFYLPVVHRGHRLTLREIELAQFQARHVVHTENRIHRKAREQTIPDHCRAALHRLLTWLEDETHRSTEVPGLGQVTAGAPQHGGMSVVPAQMRHTVHLTSVVEGVLLLNGQRVEIRAQSDGPGSLPHGHRCNNAVPADVGFNIVAPLPHQPFYVPGGFPLLHREFGVSMHMLEPLLHLEFVRHQGVENTGHRGISIIVNRLLEAIWLSSPPMRITNKIRVGTQNQTYIG